MAGYFLSRESCTRPLIQTPTARTPTYSSEISLSNMTKDVVLTASYVGNKGTRNMFRTDVNRPVPGPGDVQSRRPFPGWPAVTAMLNDGQSRYNSVQIKAQQRLAHGLIFLAGYTFAKSMDDGKGEGSVVQDAYNRRGDRGRSDW